MKKLFLIVTTFFFVTTTINAQEAKLKTVFDVKLKESSGLVFTKHGLWTFNDGASNSIYRVDMNTGKVLQELQIANTSFIDAEAIAKDEEYLYIEDAGNNNGRRKDLKIVKIKISDVDTNKQIQTINASTINFSYPEQTSFNGDKKDNNFDCESIISTKDSLFLFTKRRGDNQTSLYALSKEAGNTKAILHETFNSKGLITDAAIGPDGKYVILIGYQKGHYNSFLWILSKFKGNNFLSGKADFVLLNHQSDTWQTEGITFLNKQQLYISCETTPDHPAALYSFKQK